MARVDLEQFERDVRRVVADEIQVSLPGTVGSYDRAANRARVTWGVLVRTGVKSTAQEPQGVACPVLLPAGDGYVLSFDVAAGDHVVGLAPDRRATYWDDGSVSAPSLRQTHKIGLAAVFPVGRLSTETPMQPAGGLLLGSKTGDAALFINRARTPAQSSQVVIFASDGPAPSISLGAAADSPVARASDLLTAIDAAITAALGAAAAGDGGTAAFTAFQGAWNGLKNAILSALTSTE